MIDPRVRWFLTFAALLCVARVSFASDDTLARARDLYRNAAYDEALLVLDQMAADQRPDREVREYRLFCLLALGRKDDARIAIQALLDADPLYEPSPDQASPKVRAMVKEVRQSVLPGIVQRTYEDAKAQFDKKDPRSTAAFERVLVLLNDPDLASRPAFADLRIVSAGFRDLSKAFAQAPAAPAALPAAAGPAPAPPTPPDARKDPPTNPVVYREWQEGVSAAAALNQELPKWPFHDAAAWERRGAIDVTIDEDGAVIAAVMTTPIHPRYDPLLVKAAFSWRYTPARKDGGPVRVRKTVRVRVLPN